MTYYDLHTHVLPGMDDGSSSPAESVAMLQESFRQGCRGLIGTSHYYPQESIEQFLARRMVAWNQLIGELQTLPEEPFPQLTVGAEVYYHPNLVNDEWLPGLCLGNSDYLLLEMPFRQWSPSVIRDVRALSQVRGRKVVIAHLERFLKLTDEASMEELLRCPVLIQMNSGALLNSRLKRKALHLIREGRVDLLSTDTHNMLSRKPNMEQALVELAEKGLSAETDRILRNGAEIFRLAAENHGNIL